MDRRRCRRIERIGIAQAKMPRVVIWRVANEASGEARSVEPYYTSRAALLAGAGWR